ncbi:MAG TPA: hypothetical protein VJP80_01035 [Candidatus Saccharimonadales bacterium]|nr:hypothetical protein [Candidatus Saccharimonadales bacterium]
MEKMLRPGPPEPPRPPTYCRIYFDDRGYFDELGKPINLDALPAGMT